MRSPSKSPVKRAAAHLHQQELPQHHSPASSSSGSAADRAWHWRGAGPLLVFAVGALLFNCVSFLERAGEGGRGVGGRSTRLMLREGLFAHRLDGGRASAAAAGAALEAAGALRSSAGSEQGLVGEAAAAAGAAAAASTGGGSVGDQGGGTAPQPAPADAGQRQRHRQQEPDQDAKAEAAAQRGAAPGPAAAQGGSPQQERPLLPSSHKVQQAP